MEYTEFIAKIKEKTSNRQIIWEAGINEEKNGISCHSIFGYASPLKKLTIIRTTPEKYTFVIFSITEQQEIFRATSRAFKEVYDLANGLYLNEVL